MTSWTYRKGLHDVGDGVFAYLQPDGGWGWANAGLITGGDESLLVDTLFDLKLTAEMLAEMRRAHTAAQAIDTVVNTHANGDHCWGNQLVADAEIIASRRAARDIHLEGFDDRGDAERLAVNVDSLYRELRGEAEKTDVIELFARMAALDDSAR